MRSWELSLAFLVLFPRHFGRCSGLDISFTDFCCLSGSVGWVGSCNGWKTRRNGFEKRTDVEKLESDSSSNLSSSSCSGRQGTIKGLKESTTIQTASSTVWVPSKTPSALSCSSYFFQASCTVSHTIPLSSHLCFHVSGNGATPVSPSTVNLAQ